MKINDIDTMRELTTDYLAGALSEKEKKEFLEIINANETFLTEFRLMEQVWKDAETADVKIAVPPMSDRLKRAISGQSYGRELEDDELDMVSGGVKSDPEVDEDELN